MATNQQESVARGPDPVAPWSDPEVPLPDLTAPRVEVEQRPVPSVDLLQDDAEVVEAAADFGLALPCTRKGMHDLRQGALLPAPLRHAPAPLGVDLVVATTDASGCWPPDHRFPVDAAVAAPNRT